MLKKYLPILGMASIFALSTWGYIGYKLYTQRNGTALAQPAGSLDFWGELAGPVPPPSEVHGVYMTSDTALGDTDKRNKIFDLVDKKLINALVINVNDGSGVQDMSKLEPIVRSLNGKGIYTIARIATFQNQMLAFAKPQFAIHNTQGGLWRDAGGQPWLDASSQGAWQEILKVAENAAKLGFAEVNFDYIRFPSTGDFKNARFPFYDYKTPKKDIINAFSKFIYDNLKNEYPNLMISADVFADTILVKNDAGIGQQFNEIVDYFDFVCPMIYPSHYKPGYFGQQNPATAPYLIVSETLKRATEKLKNKKAMIRPWLQDFNIGAFYDAQKIKAEFKALQDTGYNNGWLLWNGRNVYTTNALPD